MGVIRLNGGDKIDKVLECGDFGNIKEHLYSVVGKFE